MRVGAAKATLFVFLSLGVLGGAASRAWCEWGPDGVTVSSSTAPIYIVDACSDGADGTFVIWQEQSPPGEPWLRVHHLLANGDLDPLWPTGGGVACRALAGRFILGALPDRLGGVYVWWKEIDDLFVTRLDASGEIADGWPERGRLLGAVRDDSPMPSVIEDGEHGLYAAWVFGVGGLPDWMSVQGIHLSPNNTGAGGWPNAPMLLKGYDSSRTVEYWPSLALAPDGGVYAAWGSRSLTESAIPSRWELRRLTSAGTSHPGWPEEGIGLGSFRYDLFQPLPLPPSGALLAVAPDGRGGVFVFNAEIGLHPCCGAHPVIFRKLHRITGSGRPASGWPPLGRYLHPAQGFVELGLDAAYMIDSDGHDGALIGWSEETGTENNREAFVARCLPSGLLETYASLRGRFGGHEVVTKGDGGAFLATMKGYGPSGSFDNVPAYLQLRQSLAPPGWADWIEWHPETFLGWYGDIALAPLGDRGVVFFWSQHRERIGLFARRFGPNGQVTAVEPIVGSHGLRSLRFDSGVGVRASFDLGPAAGGRFDLFDLAGRRLASAEVREAGEIVLPGTAELAAGVYFGRLIAGGERFVGRLAVTR